MRFKLLLQTIQNKALLPFNYQYPLSAAIYKIIERADSAFSLFLHDTGYINGNKRFKLFTFSDIQTPFVKSGDRMLLTTDHAEIIVCFYMPQAAQNFIKGLFMNQQLEIADAKSKVVFTVFSVEALGDDVMKKDGVEASMIIKLLSPLVAGKKNERGHYDYRSPEDADFVDCLVYNWMEKCAAIRLPVAGSAKEPEVHIEVLLFKHPPQQRLITIKANTDAETKVRGYMKFRLAVSAPQDMLEVALGAGLGLHNAQGFGCVGIE